ncbi:hypothetical protein PVAP13_3NG293200 [Panicum virgatum]|uniref:Pectinesterase inhibitor domain-containing protein n=1 Tax=Panicum virgatum TaxID=38727 RepID=A0A8T0UD73_PANVG|nr:hypothetical protein PVAP13_3NG293200 [Panicum virgatum]
MRTSLLAAPLVLAVTLAAAALCCAATIADSCNAIRDFADVAFCVSRLRSVPGAASADRHGHLLMAADLAAASGASAGAAAAKLARGERDPAVRDALQACAFLYGAASLFMLVRQAGGDCDAALGGAAGRTMAAANREFDQLAIVTTALLNTFSL